MNEHGIQSTEERNSRAKTTSSIWGMATGMLGICIPLTAVAHTGAILPIAVLATAAVSTVAIWLRGETPIPRPTLPDSSAAKRIQELEERLASLEAITNFEHRLLESKYPNAAPVSMPMAPPMPVDSGLASESTRIATQPLAS